MDRAPKAYAPDLVVEVLDDLVGARPLIRRHDQIDVAVTEAIHRSVGYARGVDVELAETIAPRHRGLLILEGSHGLPAVEARIADGHRGLTGSARATEAGQWHPARVRARADRRHGAERPALHQSASATAMALALQQDGLVNWPTAADSYWAEQFPTRVQWCHGAPGTITSLWSLPREERLDDLLCRAGKLIWTAGPLRRGSGMCHGTVGNGFAFLALRRRSGDEQWLNRAHAFAAHAIEQLDAADPRYSLWTGDLGVALYLRACLQGFDGMPSFDTL